MKKILLLLLLATFGIQAQTLQNPTYGNVKLKNNVTDNSATKVNVQSTDGTINTISKSDLVNVVEVNDVPSLPLVGVAGKIYVVKNLNKIYRWNGTFYSELVDISGKEDIANKQNSLAVDGTNTKYPTVTAVNTGLALKANLASPALTGTPTAPTATVGTNTTQIATTAFVLANAQSIPQLEYNNTDLTVWNNGKGNIAINTSFGDGALRSNTTGNSNTASGYYSLYSNTTGSSNTASGLYSLHSNTTGDNNTSSGYYSGEYIANGATPITVSNNSTFLGASTKAFADNSNNEIVIGYNATGSGSNTATLGNSSITSTILRGAVSGGSFIKSSAPTTNILLAGGGDIAQGTAFNKNFGITAGTVVEGGTLGSNAYTSTAFLPSNDGVRADINYNDMLAPGFYNSSGANTNNPVGQSYSQLIVARGVDTGLQIAGGWGTDALHFRGWGDYGSGFSPWRKVWHDGNFNPASYLPLSGGTLSGDITLNARMLSSNFTGASKQVLNATATVLYLGNTSLTNINYEAGTRHEFYIGGSVKGRFNSGGLFVEGTVTATSYTATSLPVFENNAAASSLAVGQFYRTSTGVLMVKF